MTVNSDSDSMTLKLPPEIWSHIFHHATYAPGTLVPEIYTNFSQTDPIHPLVALQRQPLVITALALVLVCKQWWHLAIPCLYRSIYIRTASCVHLLCSTLRSSAAGNGTAVGSQHLVKYTQRVDIALRSYEVVKADLDALAKLITYMPHLSIISFAIVSNRGAVDFANHVVNAIQHSAPSLRVLDWSQTRVEPSPSHIVNLLAKCTQLRILSCSRLIWSKELEHGGVPPAVTTLCLHAIIPVQTALAEHQLPDFDPNAVRRSGPTALQEIMFYLNQDPRYWADLLEVYGSQLVSVQLRIPSLYLVDVDGHLQLLMRTCPRLKRLTITADRFSCFARPHPVLPSIVYLGLKATQLRTLRPEFGTLFEFLEGLRSNVPSLKVVQLLCENNVQVLLETHAEFAVRALRPFTGVTAFRVEDREGVLVSGLRNSVSKVILGLINFRCD